MSTTRNILVITYWSFSDALIQTYTLPYLKIISKLLPANGKIYLVTLEKENHGKQLEIEPGLINIRYKYSAFGLSASLSWMKNIFLLKKIIRKNSIDTIHTFCTPAGMIGYILSILTSKPLILDSYEPHAEAMVENGEWQKDSISFKLLFGFEKKQSAHAKKIIGTTKQMKEYALKKYGITLNDFFVKPACVDLEKFNLSFKKDPSLVSELNLQNKIVCVYAGKFGGIYLKEEVFEFYKACYQFWKDDFVALLLTNHPLEEINALLLQYGLPKKNCRILFVPHAQVNKYIGLGDFAITPVKPVPTKKYCTPIKDGEYWAMGLPVVIPANISTDSEIIEKNNIGYVLKELTYPEYEIAVKKIDALLKDKMLSEKIRKIAEEERNFSIAKAVYTIIYS
ncbi:MAG: glycosyltransferase [Bacteroidetes bacterium]|nr:glycosyltransferase [Bacteroidota bacterium]